MTSVTLTATPAGRRRYHATIEIAGVIINSAETYPTVAEAIAAAAEKLLTMPERLARLDRPPTSNVHDP